MADGPRVLLLGARRGLNENRWKDDIAEAGQRLGWDVNHVNARGIPTDEVQRLAKGVDLLLWARTHGHDPEGDIAGMLRRVEDEGAVTVALHLDLYWGIPRREVEIGVHPWWSCQYVLTADGGRRDWAGRGVNHLWCPPAMGHRFFGRGQIKVRYAHRAVFVGGLVKDIHGYHRAGLLRWAKNRWRAGFARYGGHPGVWGKDLSDLYASTGVVIGDSAAAPYYWSDRVPTTLGRGGLLTHPDTPGLRHMGFNESVMVLYRRADLRALGHALDVLDEGRRREMTDSALALIEERHMWTHRLRQIEALCGS